MLSNTWKRIAFSYALLVLITAGILALLLGDEFERREEDALRVRLGDQARAGANSVAPLMLEDAPVTSTNALAHNLSSIFGTRVTFIRQDGVVVGDSEQEPGLMENHKARPEVQQALASPGQLGSTSRLSVTVREQLLYVAVAVTDPADSARIVGVSRVAYPITSVEQARNSLWGSLGIAVLLVSLPVMLLSVLLARSIAEPLSHLRRVTSRFGTGDVKARSRLAGKGEIGELSVELNAMVDQLENTISERTQERNRMAAVFTNMHDGIILTDAGGRVESMNPTALQLLGTTLEKARDQSLIEATHDHTLHQALEAALHTPGERRRVETTLSGQNLTATITAILNRDSILNGLVVLQNVTELRQLERARRDFVANIGHELRTPLASIKLLIETLQTAVHEDPQAARQFLQRINIEVDGLTRLVRELLELSKIESGQVQLHRQPVAVSDLLVATANRLGPQAARSGLSLDVRPIDESSYADADPDRIEQVLVNLVHNAIKFTPPAGR